MTTSQFRNCINKLFICKHVFRWAFGGSKTATRFTRFTAKKRENELVAEETNDAADSDNSIVQAPLHDVIDSEAFVPRLFAILSHALVWRESKLLRGEFSLGTNDWRVLSALAVRPGSSATDVSEFLVMNKAVVSKAVNVLISRNLIASTEGPRGSRKLFLTHPGVKMHNQMLPISLGGEKILLAHLSESEVATLRQILTKLVGNISSLTSSPEVTR